MPAKLLIFGPGENRFRLENEQILVNLSVPVEELFHPAALELFKI